MKKMPPLNALKAFEAAARHLNFTKAAEELFVTQAAISHQIKSLEDFLGLKLFVRRKRNLYLTEVGQDYFLEVRQVFQTIQNATQKILQRNARGALTIAVPASYASIWLVPHLNDFTNQYPDIDVRLKAVDQDEHFLDESMDAAIYIGQGYWPGLSATRLQVESIIPVCAPQLLAGEHPLQTLADLQYHTLLHETSTERWADWLGHFDVDASKAKSGALYSHTMLTLQAAAIGQGVALASDFLASTDLQTGRLVAPFSEKLIDTQGYYLVCDKNSAALEKVMLFRQWLLQAVAKDK